MRILIVIGAGASYDAATTTGIGRERLPLANELFSTGLFQSRFLTKYNLMGLASQLRLKSRVNDFNVEFELDQINNQATRINDLNRLQDLFKTRFYIHNLIQELTKNTLSNTSYHTVYIDLLNQLKDWIDEDQQNHFVDIVSFNYDNLLEHAMMNVYGYNWRYKSVDNKMNAYLYGNNLKIYKPHGSTNWGKKINQGKITLDDLFDQFNEIEIDNNPVWLDPNYFLENNRSVEYIPAISIPFKHKSGFDECPGYMKVIMLEAIKSANALFSLGWKGADTHFTSLLKSDGKQIKKVAVISPSGDTYLNEVFPDLEIQFIKHGFREFIYKNNLLRELLNKLND